MSASENATGHIEPLAKRRWWLMILPLVVLLLLTAAAAFGLARLGKPLTFMPLEAVVETELAKLSPKKLEARAKAAQTRLRRLQPNGKYIVVDTYLNRLRLMENNTVIREALCSTGTGIVLIDPRNKKKWVFDTPLGEKIIERKQKKPVWIKPDWAFIEEGEEPPKDPAERFDPYSLGDYGLYMGDGYIIHGTLFKSLLGRRATHGCIRLGDEDLAFLYENVPVGTRVYLY